LVASKNETIDFLCIHLTLIPYLQAAQELKRMKPCSFLLTDCNFSPITVPFSSLLPHDLPIKEPCPGSVATMSEYKAI